MYISNLTIKNYRNFDDFNIDLQPFTLIIGENNSGKSNLLEALGLIFSQEITVYKKRILEVDDINLIALQKYQKEVADATKPIDSIAFPEVVIEVTMEKLNDNQAAVVGDWFVNKELTVAKLTYMFCIREGWQNKKEWLLGQRKIAVDRGDYKYVDLPIKQYEYNIFGGGDLTNKADYYFLRMLKMDILDALRDAKRELIAGGEYRTLYKVLVNRDESQFSDIKENLMALDGVLKNHAELKSIKNDIESYLKKISLQSSPNDNSVDFKFSRPEFNEILKKLSLIYGNDPIGIERNGLGRNNLLFIALILSHLTGNGVGVNQTYFRLVGIEEPESHLHPHLQMHLARNITKEVGENMQIILTSHSSHLAAKLDIASTYILYKQGEKTERHQIMHGLDVNDQSVKYLTKYLDATNSTMFFARKVMLVEGASEEILFPLLFKIYKSGKSLEQVGCSLLNMRGLSFKHYLEIIKNGFFIKAVAFTDRDKDFGEEDIVVRAEELKTRYEAECDKIKVKITDKDTFEKDIIESNKDGAGKVLLLSVLKEIRPRKGTAIEVSTAGNPINIEDFFGAIKNCKTEFALALVNTLLLQATGFTIPPYIAEGFDYIDS